MFGSGYFGQFYFGQSPDIPEAQQAITYKLICAGIVLSPRISSTQDLEGRISSRSDLTPRISTDIDIETC